MRLVDANVFIYAFLKPKRELKDHERRLKEAAKAIATRISEGEEVAITPVQLAEVANVVESFLPLNEAREIEEFLIMAPNVKILSVGREDYMEALELAREKDLGISDAVACVVMRREGLTEIYSFDKDFDKVEWIHRIKG